MLCASAHAVVVYDGRLNSGSDLVSDQGWFVYLPPTGAAPVFAGGGRTTIDSSADPALRGGFFSHVAFPPFIPSPVPINAAWPTLNAASGYTVRFDARVVAESHVTPHRAGFNLISIASDQTGVELGFWTGEVWCQEGGSGAALFTHAEGGAFDTTRLTRYTLVVQAGAYDLYAGGRRVLHGTLRNYTAFDASGSGLPFDPYETRNFLFLGDDTASAGATAEIARIEVLTAPVRPCNAADVAGLGGAAGADGQNTVDDLVAFLSAFFAGDAMTADVGALGGAPGPDGQLTVDDIVVDLAAFFAPCVP